MTSLERRMSLIERRLSNIEARLKISDPDRPKFGSNHQGTKTKEVLIQEGFSLRNAYNPDTFSKKELAKWNKAYQQWKDDISGFSVKEITDIENEIHKLLHPEEEK